MILSNLLFPLVPVFGVENKILNTSFPLSFAAGIELKSILTRPNASPAESYAMGNPAVVNVTALSMLYENNCRCWPLAVLEDCVP